MFSHCRCGVVLNGENLTPAVVAVAGPGEGIVNLSDVLCWMSCGALGWSSQPLRHGSNCRRFLPVGKLCPVDHDYSSPELPNGC